MTAARVLAALRRVGQDAVLLGGDGSSPVFAASIQPQRTLPAEDTGPLGAGRRRRYTLYAPPGVGIGSGSRIRCGAKTYLVLNAEEMALAGEALYTWGTAELEGGDAP